MFHVLLMASAVAVVYGQADNLIQLAIKLEATELVRLLSEVGLNDTLATQGPFTLFAPSNEAFEFLPRPVRDELMRNKTLLTDLLRYHVVSGTILSTQIKNEEVVPSLFAQHNLRFNIYDDGKLITADGAPVALADQRASNGIIHLLRRVIFPIPEVSVVGLVSRDPFLTTLLKVLKTTALDILLEGGPFTLFAPTDEAFDRLPPEVLNRLLANVTELTDVLKYHLINGTDYVEGLSNGQRLHTVEGKELFVRKLGFDRVIVNTAWVERADLSVTNGVVQIINNVLLPPRLIDL